MLLAVKIKKSLPFAFVLSLACLQGPGWSATTPKDFLKRHCSECHDDTTQKRNFRVDNLPLELTTPAAAKGWRRARCRRQKIRAHRKPHSQAR
jgi:hypothetical protein